MEKSRIFFDDSLALTVDAINDAFFFGRAIPAAQKREAALWLASRAGVERSYGGLPAPTDNDYASGVKVFTGEPVKSKAALGHILGEEAMQALAALRISNKRVNDALGKSAGEFGAVVTNYDGKFGPYGMYCCGICSAAFWRNLSSGAMDDALGGASKVDHRVVAGIKLLNAHRREGGKWRRFPLWYTLYALTSLDPERLPKSVRAAKSELLYAAPACERVLKSRAPAVGYAQRRCGVAERVLELV